MSIIIVAVLDADIARFEMQMLDREGEGQSGRTRSCPQVDPTRPGLLPGRRRTVSGSVGSNFVLAAILLRYMLNVCLRLSLYQVQCLMVDKGGAAGMSRGGLGSMAEVLLQESQRLGVELQVA